MTSETIDACRGAPSEVAETIAPTWERRRAEIEEVSTPVREWMLHVLRLRRGIHVGLSATAEGFKSSRTAVPVELFDVAANRDQAERGDRDADR